MNKKVFLVILFFISGMLFAQNTSTQVTHIMDKTLQKYNALSAFSLDFTVNIDENAKTIKNFKGVLFVKKDKYFVIFEEQVIANDGKMIWNYQKSANEVSFFEVEEDDLMFNPQKILNNWAQEYAAKFIREEELQKKQTFIVDLTPKKRSPFYKIRLFVDKETFYIQQIMMYEMDGSTITYAITKFTPNAVISDAKFTFNKNDYPNVQINDMR